MAKKKKDPPRSVTRSIRIQQVIFMIIGVIIILSMLISMISN
jgi:hypothetical protein